MEDKRQKPNVIEAKLPFASIRIDDMQDSDLPAIMEIERQSFSSPWSEAAFRQGLSQRRNHVHFLIARHCRHPIAYINFWTVADEAHIVNFAVSSEFRNQGVGKYLLAKSLEHIKRLGGVSVFLEVRVSNIPAQNLYRQFGFRIVSIRKRYYPDNGEDAYVFWLSDLPEIDFRIHESRTNEWDANTCDLSG